MVNLLLITEWPMKLHILNDLHTEFEGFTPPVTDADLAVLAGDIGRGRDGLRWAQANFPNVPVLYVPGNHEFYHHDIGLTDELKAHAPDHIHVLNNDQVVIGGVRFLGSILWTDFELFGTPDKAYSMQQARQRMPDFTVIHKHGQRFTPEDSIQLHTASREWLAARLAESFNGKTVVITHHAPSSRSVHHRFANDLLTPAFASRLDDLIAGDRVALWIHGHTHDAFDYEVHGTRVVCNPRGYAPHALTPGFRPNLVVEV